MTEKAVMDAETRTRIIETKITCPFLGSAVNQERLSIVSEANNPLAGIEDVRKLGNTGGGDLGDLLVIFAEGNHGFMRGASRGVLDIPVPPSLFSLELPGSQGSHPGHSGILQGDPRKLDSGRLSEEDFGRLAALAKEGLIKQSDIGRFISENLKRDVASKVTGSSVARLFLEDLGALVGAAGSALVGLAGANGAANLRTLEGKLTKLLAEDNLVGSSGEFGLLFAFLNGSPRFGRLDGEPALSFDDVRSMFLDKRLPEGWETWRKTRADWVVHTASLILSAAKEFRKD